MSAFHQINIADIKKETPTSVSVSFSIPNELKQKFQFIPGQYLTLKTNINGHDVRRSYSICSANNNGEIRVAIKQVENGLFSTYATKQLSVGDTLEVGEPEGRFLLETNSNNQKSYMAVAAGSGITPIASMIKSVLQNEPNSKFVLLYANKSVEETIFYHELNELQEKYPERFFVYYTFTQSNEENALFGRIDNSKINYVLKNKHTDISFDHFYLCGPEEMITNVSGILKDNGIADSAIAFELFTTKSTTLDKGTVTSSGETQATIILDDEETKITIKANETILDAVLRNELDAPYSCQGGVCSSCICLIEEGEAKMRQNSVLTDSEIEEGLVLSCQSLVTSNNITVNYDEV